MCEREAERDRFAPEAAQRAVQTDFRQGLSQGFLRRLSEVVETALQQLPGIRAVPILLEMGGAQTVIERNLFDYTARALQVAPDLNAHEVLEASLRLIVDEHCNAQLREVRCHAFRNGVNGHPAVKALADALRQVDRAAIARGLLERAPAPRGPLRPDINLDEAL